MRKINKIMISLFVFFMLINTICFANSSEERSFGKFEINKIITGTVGVFLVILVLYISYKKDLEQEKIAKEIIEINKEISIEEQKRKNKENTFEEKNLFLEMKEDKSENKIETIPVNLSEKEEIKTTKKSNNTRKTENKKKGKTSYKK